MKKYRVKVNGKLFEVELETVEENSTPIKSDVKPVESKPVEAPKSGEGQEVLAPIAGKVLDVKIAVGDSVKKGQTLFIIEAMKLENEIKCPFEGKVVSVAVAKGSNVSNKQLLAVVK